MAQYWPHGLLLILMLALWAWEKRAPQMVDRIEENILIGLMGLITLVSFAQVVARYMFNTGWSAALEFTTLCFSWLILFGMAYGIKKGTHLGVDIAFQRLAAGPARWLGIFGAAMGLLYGLLLLDASWMQLLGVQTRSGAIDYWHKMWRVGIGSEELRWPQFVQDWFSTKDRVQRWIVLAILPLSLALLCLRSLQAMAAIYRGQRQRVIAGHEAEELVEQNQGVLADLK